MSKKTVSVIEGLNKKEFLEKEDILDLLNLSQSDTAGLSEEQKDQYKKLMLGLSREDILKASPDVRLEVVYASYILNNYNEFSEDEKKKFRSYVLGLSPVIVNNLHSKEKEIYISLIMEGNLLGFSGLSDQERTCYIENVINLIGGVLKENENSELSYAYNSFVVNVELSDFYKLSTNIQMSYVSYILNNYNEFSKEEKEKVRSYVLGLSPEVINKLHPKERVIYISLVIGRNLSDFSGLSDQERTCYIENVINLICGANDDIAFEEQLYYLDTFDLEAFSNRDCDSTEAIAYAKYIIGVVDKEKLKRLAEKEEKEGNLGFYSRILDVYNKILSILEKKDFDGLTYIYNDFLANIDLRDFSKLSLSTKVSYVNYVLSNKLYLGMSDEQQIQFRSCVFDLDVSSLKSISSQAHAEFVRYLVDCFNENKISRKELKAFNGFILAVRDSVFNLLTDSEKDKYSELLRVILEKRKYTNTTPLAFCTPIFKKFQAGVCKAASKLFASKDFEIEASGVKLVSKVENGVEKKVGGVKSIKCVDGQELIEDADSIKAYTYVEVPVNEIVPDGKAFFVASHQWVLDNLMIVITNPKHAVILHNKDAAFLLRFIQWLTGLIEVDRADELSRLNSKYDIGSGLAKKRKGLLTVGLLESTWNRSLNKILLGLTAGSLELIKKLDLNIPIVPVAFHYVYDNVDGEKKIVKAYAMYGEPIYISKDSKVFPSKKKTGNESEKSIVEQLEESLASLKYHAMLKDRKTVKFDPNYLVNEYKKYGLDLRVSDALQMCSSLVSKNEEAGLNEYGDNKYWAITDRERIRQEYSRREVPLTEKQLDEIVVGRNQKLREIKSKIIWEYADFLKATALTSAGDKVAGGSENSFIYRDSSDFTIPPNESSVVREKINVGSDEHPEYKYQYKIEKSIGRAFVDGELSPKQFDIDSEIIVRLFDDGNEVNSIQINKPISINLSSVTPEVMTRDRLIGSFVEYRSATGLKSKKQGLVIGVTENSLEGENSADRYLMVIYNEDGNRVYVRSADLSLITSDKFEPKGKLSNFEVEKNDHWTAEGEYLTYSVCLNNLEEDIIQTTKYRKGDIVYIMGLDRVDFKITDVEIRDGVVIYQVYSKDLDCKRWVNESRLFSDKSGLRNASIEQKVGYVRNSVLSRILKKES